MRWCASILAAAGIVLLLARPVGQSKHRDGSKLICGFFLGAGTENMALLLWWLRGYPAGKRGNIQNWDRVSRASGFFAAVRVPTIW